MTTSRLGGRVSDRSSVDLSRHRPHLTCALQAANWVLDVAITTESGCKWPVYAGSTEQTRDIFQGQAGIILFLLECFAAVGEPAYLEGAARGADDLLASIGTEPSVGLYSGLAGIGLALLHMYRVTGEPRYAVAMRECITLLEAHAERSGDGVRIVAPVPTELADVAKGASFYPYDLVFGSAGIGLFLLEASVSDSDGRPSDLVDGLARHLLSAAIHDPNGMTWELGYGIRSNMPNFAHGSAGVIYFLASCYLRTGDAACLDAAIAGAGFLANATWHDDDVSFLPVTLPSSTGRSGRFVPRYSQSWAHGAIGTSRMWLRLYEATADIVWLECMRRGARGVLSQCIPPQIAPNLERSTAHSWNAGAPAEAGLFLGIYRATGDARWLHLARLRFEDVMAHAVVADSRAFWPSVGSHPNLAPGFVGLKDGAAGVGLHLLYFDGAEHGRELSVVLPDDPFSRIELAANHADRHPDA
ncbi:MAG: lanthionine synthetase LanC family protein [Gammaproteobacteria bacterium]